MERWEVQNYARQNRQDSAKITVHLLSDYLRLERRLKDAYQNVRSDYRYQEDVQFSNSAVDPYQLFILNALYCLCLGVLYSSIVPILGELTADLDISSPFVSISGPEAMRHSKLMAYMSIAFLKAGLDHTRLPPAIGSSAFISCFAHAAASSTQGDSPEHSFYDLAGAVIILERLKQYWQPLRKLVCLLYYSSIPDHYTNLFTVVTTRIKIPSP